MHGKTALVALVLIHALELHVVIAAAAHGRGPGHIIEMRLVRQRPRGVACNAESKAQGAIGCRGHTSVDHAPGALGGGVAVVLPGQFKKAAIRTFERYAGENILQFGHAVAIASGVGVEDLIKAQLVGVDAVLQAHADRAGAGLVIAAAGQGRSQQEGQENRPEAQGNNCLDHGKVRPPH